MAGQLVKARIKIGARARPARAEPDGPRLQTGKAIIARGHQFDNMRARFQQIDKRHEPMPVQPALVKIVRRPIGGGDNHHTKVEQKRKQTPQNGGIGNVLDLKFVKTQKRGLARNFARHARHRVARLVGPLAYRVNARMGFLHKGVKMHAPLGAHGHFVEKQIHQHRFAAPNPAIQIKSFGRGFCRQPETVPQCFPE